MKSNKPQKGPRANGAGATVLVCEYFAKREDVGMIRGDTSVKASAQVKICTNGGRNGINNKKWTSHLSINNKRCISCGAGVHNS